MALVKRANTDHYYRSVRVGQKVKRVYVGCGEKARLAAAVDEHCRLRQQMDRCKLGADRERWEAACATLDELIAVTDLLVTAVLLAEGFYQHHQGEWRRRRGKSITQDRRWREAD
jgi:hypothetical protein